MAFFNVPHIRFSPDQNIMPAKAIAIEYHEKYSKIYLKLPDFGKFSI